MGIVCQRLRLHDAARADLEDVDAEALVDGGAADLCIPRGVAIQLRLEAIEQRVVTDADGRQDAVDYVGPVLVECFGRRAFTGARVMGDQVLLGAIPMESMDLPIDPRRQELIPNPAHLNIPGAYAMGYRTHHP